MTATRRRPRQCSFRPTDWAIRQPTGKDDLDRSIPIGTMSFIARWDGTEAVMNEQIRREIEQIEDNQAQLRESIEHTKTLSNQADRLMSQHKQTLETQATD